MSQLSFHQAFENAVVNMVKEVIPFDPDIEYLEDIRKVIELSNYEYLFMNIILTDDEDELKDFLDEQAAEFEAKHHCPFSSECLKIIFLVLLLYKHAAKEEEDEDEETPECSEESQESQE